MREDFKEIHERGRAAAVKCLVADVGGRREERCFVLAKGLEPRLHESCGAGAALVVLRPLDDLADVILHRRTTIV